MLTLELVHDREVRFERRLSRGLGCCCLSVRGSENQSLNLANSNKMSEIDNYEFLEGIFGGGGRSRTYDAADMSHPDSEPNLLDSFIDLLLETTSGDRVSDDPSKTLQ